MSTLSDFGNLSWIVAARINSAAGRPMSNRLTFCRWTDRIGVPAPPEVTVRVMKPETIAVELLSVAGTNIEAVMDEVLRRIGWEREHGALRPKDPATAAAAE